TEMPNAGASLRSARCKTSLRELEKRARPVRKPFAPRRQAVFLHVRHLAEGAGMAGGQKHRIVAETLLAARRPDERAVDGALEFLDVFVGPGEAERADEMRRALAARTRAALAQLVFHDLHGPPKVFLRARPARRIDAGIAAERIDRQPGIVGKGGQT